MKLFTLLLFISTLLTFDNKLLSQLDTSVNLIQFGSTSFYIGTIQGIHPNLRNGGFSSYVYGELSQELKVLGIPFKFNGRLSNEELRIGKPNYFHFSYDNSRLKDENSIYTSKFKYNNEKELKNQQAEKYKLEGMLSYKKEMLRKLELEKYHYSLQNYDSLNQQGKYSINDSLNVDYPSLAIRNYKIDSLNYDINTLTNDLNIANIKYDSISDVINGFQNLGDYDISTDKFKLKRFNLGFTSLSRSGLSNNAIPIQGIHLEGTYKNTFYDFSAGVTQVIQNFNTEIFNQYTAGSQNVFNVNEFYQTKKMRVATSIIAGVGDRNKNNIRVEHFYLGKTFEAIKKKRPEEFSNTINTAGEYSIIKNLKLGYLIGVSFLGNDTLNSKVDIGNLAYKGTVVYQLPKIRSFLEVEYRSLGRKYDSNSQGVIVNGTTHKMIGFTKSIFKSSKISIKYMEDIFSKTDSIVVFDNSKKIFSHLSLRLNSTNRFLCNYNYIRGSGSEIGSKVGQLGTLTYINEIKIGKNQMLNTVQAGYTRMPSRFNYQEITQVSATSQYHFSGAFFGLKGSYEKYEGLQNFWGENYVVEPSFGYGALKGDVMVSFQYSKSKQFGADYGMNLRLNFSPSPYISWQLIAQKWLLKERTFFLYQAPSEVSSWYVDAKIIVNLNVKK